MTRLLRNAAKAYATLAVILSSVFLILVLANVIVLVYPGNNGGVLLGIDRRYLVFEPPPYIRTQIYPGMTVAEMSEVIQENWAISYEYAPYRQFQPKATRGKYTSNSAAGFRFCKDQGAWPPSPENYNVFLFGGSTAYNVGVPENDTIASHLQATLKELKGRLVRVYNFGCPLFFSSSERVLFERLLVEGHRPDLAIFLDGLNEYYHVTDEPGFSEQISTLFANSDSVPYHLRFLVLKLPLVSLIHDRYFPSDSSGKGESNEEYARKDILESIQRRYFENLKNIKAVADVNDVKTLFIWQPVPLYKYTGDHPFVMGMPYGKHARSRFGYTMMAEYVNQHAMPPNFIWLADMQEDLSGMLYVDLVHYSGRMSKEIAVRIGTALREGRLLE